MKEIKAKLKKENILATRSSLQMKTKNKIKKKILGRKLLAN